MNMSYPGVELAGTSPDNRDRRLPCGKQLHFGVGRITISTSRSSVSPRQDRECPMGNPGLQRRQTAWQTARRPDLSAAGAASITYAPFAPTFWLLHMHFT